MPTTDTTAARITTTTPRGTVRSTPDGYLLELDLPGVPREGLEVQVLDRELTVRGHRADSRPDADILHREIRGADYERTFTLGSDVDPTRIAAALADGVLRLTLPKAPELQPRKIDIQG